MSERLRPAWLTLLLLAPLAVVQAVAGEPLLAPPLAASAALVAATPAAPAARPQTVLFGHLVSVTAGFAVALALGPGPVAATAAAGLGVAAMVAAGRFHAPAVASAVLVGAVGEWVPAVALLGGALVIVGLAALPRLGRRSQEAGL
ncbi:HPP family protein [Actinomadura rudentiformis]|uniref:HPP family protein n=1 Tax=Actinomadura rudentiformis TaxID=359158 RepID=UPI00178C5C7A|nr:HPP family protein [Actinomadura rudentiformis]